MPSLHRAVTRRLTPRAWGVAYLVHGAITVWLVVGYVGPGRWLGELQLRAFGAYFPVLSIAVLFLPVVALARVMAMGPMDGHDVIGLATGPRVKPYLRGAGVLVISGVILPIVGRHAFAPDLGFLTVRQVAKEEATGFYAEVHGHIAEAGLTVEDGGSKMLYLPMRDGAEEDDPVPLVVSVPEHQLERAVAKDGDSNEVSVRGYVDASLPGDVKSWLKSGDVSLAEDFKVLRPGIARERARRWFFALAAASLLGAAVLFWKDRRAAAS